MTKYTTTTALAFMATAAGAAAQVSDRESGVIDQVQLGDVWSQMDVQVPEYTERASSTATTMGNSATAIRDSGDVSAEISQEFDADARAATTLQGDSAGVAMSTTTAYGNGATDGTNYGYNDYRTEQSADGSVDASSRIDLRGAYDVGAGTTAVANVSSTENNFGTNAADQVQTSSADVTADTDADVLVNGYSATYATTAGANSTSSTGYTSTNYNRARQSTEDGSSVQATSDVYMQSASNVSAISSGFGNSATVHNEWGYATLGLEGAPTEQTNNADIDAQSYVTLDHWSGYASSSAYGVGNSALISNVGSDTEIHADQYNSGTVSTQASFSGQSWTGGTDSVSATSIGNAATASVCNYCSEAAVSGRVNQTNDGNTYARGQANVTYGGTVSGSATAIGNTATLQSSGD